MNGGHPANFCQVTRQRLQGKQVAEEAAAKVKAAGGGAPKRVALQKEQPRARAPVRKRNAATKSLQKVMPAMEDD